MTSTKCGGWSSPVTPELMQKYLKNIDYLTTDQCLLVKKSFIYWSETCPNEGGISVIYSYNIDSNESILWTNLSYNVRSTLHEYGGASFFVHNGCVYFSNFSDQQLYKQTKPMEKPMKLSDSKNCRYGNGFYSTQLNAIFIVREDHNDEKDVKNTIVMFYGSDEKVILEGADFYSSPRISEDGKQICWIEWMFPNMPWDNTRCCIGQFDSTTNTVIPNTVVTVCTGTDTNPISCTLPQWTNKDNQHQLLYIKDVTNFWNIWLREEGEEVNLTAVNEDIGDPMWMLDYRKYSYYKNEIVVTHYGGIVEFINIKDLSSEKIDISTRLTYMCYPDILYDGSLAVIGHSSSYLPTVYRITRDGKLQTIARSGEISELDSDFISIPKHISFPVKDADTVTGPNEAFGYYYPPCNPNYLLSDKTSPPPLLVLAHGGPTAATFTQLDLKVQYWTSRGFAVFDVNYRGSTGYGKEYRHSLRGKWGVYDMEDCCTGAMYLVSQGLADRNMICIKGGSAGGYLTLCCLTFSDIFRAGSSNYGIGDLNILIKDTHKFESRYCDLLIGNYYEFPELYWNRSPINFSDQIKCPVIFFQGTEDKVVPPQQTIQMYEEVRNKGLPCCLVMYENEQHGFRILKNIVHNITSELYFFSKIFGFETPDIGNDPITIDNYDT